MDLINSKGLYKSAAKNLPEEERDRLRIDGKDFAIGVDYDRIDVTYPTNTTEQFQYSLSGQTVRTVLVTYLNSVKRDITSVEVV